MQLWLDTAIREHTTKHLPFSVPKVINWTVPREAAPMCFLHILQNCHALWLSQFIVCNSRLQDEQWCRSTNKINAFIHLLELEGIQTLSPKYTQGSGRQTFLGYKFCQRRKGIKTLFCKESKNYWFKLSDWSELLHKFSNSRRTRSSLTCFCKVISSKL